MQPSHPQNGLRSLMVAYGQPHNTKKQAPWESKTTFIKMDYFYQYYNSENALLYSCDLGSICLRCLHLPSSFGFKMWLESKPRRYVLLCSCCCVVLMDLSSLCQGHPLCFLYLSLAKVLFCCLRIFLLMILNNTL